MQTTAYILEVTSLINKPTLSKKDKKNESLVGFAQEHFGTYLTDYKYRDRIVN